MNPITTNIRTFSFNYSFIGNMFVFPFLPEKHPLLKVESYVTQILEIKKAKTDTAKSYFDMTFQTWN